MSLNQVDGQHPAMIAMEEDKNDQEPDRRAVFIASLRACADFLEAHPAVPVPAWTQLNVFIDTRPELVRIGKTASWEKVYQGDYFILRQTFDPNFTLDITAERQTVCRKVVTGTRIVPARPAHEVEEFEWVCDDAALLAKARGDQ